MFKYLVTQTDPQKWFTVSVLLINFLCVIVISVSYIIINIKTNKSASTLTESVDRSIVKRNRKLQSKVTAIIFTDFLCWVPLTITCFLHFGGFLDATPGYPIFSTIILPINSVINPLLYDSLLGAFLNHPFRAIFKKASLAISIKKRHHLNNPAADTKEQRGVTQ